MTLEIGKDTYATLEEADAYHIAMGNTAWPSETTEDVIEKKEAALRSATSFVDNITMGNWKGQRAKADQFLAWPRKGIIDPDGYKVADTDIPREIKVATYESALKIFSGDDLLPDTTNNIASEAIAGAVKVSYFEGKNAMPAYNRIFNLLNIYLRTPLGKSSETRVTFSTRGYTNG